MREVKAWWWLCWCAAYTYLPTYNSYLFTRHYPGTKPWGLPGYYSYLFTRHFPGWDTRHARIATYGTVVWLNGCISFMYNYLFYNAIPISIKINGNLKKKCVPVCVCAYHLACLCVNFLASLEIESGTFCVVNDYLTTRLTMPQHLLFFHYLQKFKLAQCFVSSINLSNNGYTIFLAKSTKWKSEFRLRL